MAAASGRSVTTSVPAATATASSYGRTATAARTHPAEASRVRTRESSRSTRPSARSEDDDGAEHLAALHPVEGGLDVVEPDRFGDEPVEREPALQVEVDEQGKVPTRQAVAVPGRLHGAATTE